MTNPRTCDDQGLLVDGNSRLPLDTCEYYRRTVCALVGCNRLRCARCGDWVRSGPPEVGLKEDVSVDVAALFSTEDWLSLPFVERRKPALSSENQVRLYSCKCACWEATRVDLIDNEHDSPSDPNVPWACAGHALPDFPVALDELTVGAETDWAELVQKVLAGACPRSLELAARQIDEGPSLWLGWLYCYLAGSPLAEKLTSAIAAHIEDSNPRIIGQVLYFFARFPFAEGVERLVARAEAAPNRVAVGYPIAEYQWAPTLWDVIVARAEQRAGDALEQRMIQLVQSLLLIPLASLSHEEQGPSSLMDLLRESWARFGKDTTTASAKYLFDDYAKMHKSERVDVISNALKRYSIVFDNDELRLFIADHIVEIDAAAPGRWRLLMDVLSDRYHKPQLGHLIVVAGLRLIESRAVCVDEFREWMKQRSPHGWIDDAWVLPLETVLDKKPPVN